MNIKEVKEDIAAGRLVALVQKLKDFVATDPIISLKIELFSTIFSELYLREYNPKEMPDELLPLLLSSKTIKELYPHQIFTTSFKNRYFIEYYVQNYSNFDSFLKDCARYYNIGLIELLEDIYGQQEVFLSLSRQGLPTLEEFRQLPAPKTMAKVVYQFQDHFGKITVDGIKLTCAAIRERKKEYDFCPVICEDTDQLSALCSLINEHHRQLQDQAITFIVVDKSHYVSGLIKINEKTEVNILLLDSLGYKKSYEGDVMSYAMIDVFIRCFPKMNLYFSQEVRQNAAKGCSVFAIDDARHLQTTERYLPPTYNGMDLFIYLEQHSTLEETEVLTKDTKEPSDKQNIVFCTLPPHLKRTMQSTRLLEKKNDYPVNKAGETMYDSSIKFFGVDDKLKRQNLRLNYKFKKMCAQNISYLRTHTDKECEEATYVFTLEGFKDRISVSPAVKFKP